MPSAIVLGSLSVNITIHLSVSRKVVCVWSGS